MPGIRRILANLWRFIFKPAARYPADPRAIFILAVCVFTGITAALLDATPNTLNYVLPAWIVKIWATILTVGSITTVLGMLFQSVNGIISEQIGSVMVGVSCIFYGCIALALTGVSGVQPIAIIIAWGVACLLRWVQLQALINSAQRKAAA